MPTTKYLCIRKRSPLIAKPYHETRVARFRVSESKPVLVASPRIKQWYRLNKGAKAEPTTSAEVVEIPKQAKRKAITEDYGEELMMKRMRH